MQATPLTEKTLQSPLKPLHQTLLLLGLNLFWRLIWLPFNQGTYTDGILQISMFDKSLGLTFWPPLYPLIVVPLGFFPPLGAEGAGRLVSLIAGTLTIIPLESITRRLFGRRAALMAVLAYTASPDPLRWSLQVMTDAPFMALFTASLASLVISWEALWPAEFDQGGTKRERDSIAGLQWLLLASLLGALATLTRYQGILLVPPIALLAWRARGVRAPMMGGAMPPLVLAGLPWLMVPLWILRGGTSSIEAHFSQIGDRTSAGSSVDTLLNYWYVFEQFILDSPYFITYGIFGFFLFGLFRTQFTTVRIRWSAYAGLYFALALICVQSVFQSFQSRYLLPLVPLVCMMAGHGMAVWERRCANNPARFWMLAGPALAYGILFSALVAFYQGEPFIDIKQAGKALRDLPEGTRIATTESFNPRIFAPKLHYWSGGRKMLPFGSFSLQPGDVVVLPSCYGGWERYQELKRNVTDVYKVEELGVFNHNAYPLMPDIMEDPMTHQNPLAMYLRYKRQRFETTVYKILGYATADPAASGSIK